MKAATKTAYDTFSETTKKFSPNSSKTTLNGNTTKNSSKRKSHSTVKPSNRAFGQQQFQHHHGSTMKQTETGGSQKEKHNSKSKPSAMHHASQAKSGKSVSAVDELKSAVLARQKAKVWFLFNYFGSNFETV